MNPYTMKELREKEQEFLIHIESSKDATDDLVISLRGIAESGLSMTRMLIKDLEEKPE